VVSVSGCPKNVWGRNGMERNGMEWNQRHQHKHQQQHKQRTVFSCVSNGSPGVRTVAPSMSGIRREESRRSGEWVIFLIHLLGFVVVSPHSHIVSGTFHCVHLGGNGGRTPRGFAIRGMEAPRAEPRIPRFHAVDMSCIGYIWCIYIACTHVQAENASYNASYNASGAFPSGWRRRRRPRGAN